MLLDRPPLFEALAPASSILLVGAGGGFDIYAGLPLLFALERMGKTVHLANVTFSGLGFAKTRPIHDEVVEVAADAGGSNDYFPEKFLARWFAQREAPRSIYCLEKTGCRPLTEALRKLAHTVEADALVLVDGGTDILMRGDEAGLGTPAEDITTLAAAQALDLDIKLVTCLGFGVDAYHGVCHAHFLENVAALQRSGHFLGALSVLPHMPEAQAYLDAVAWVHERCPLRPSIVNASIASALEGDYGDTHRTPRTRGSELWINPLMSTYFSFDLEAVAARVLYLDALRDTETIFEVSALIEAYRHGATARPRTAIPV